MKTTSLSFPHPVLGVRDDIQGLYNVEIKLSFSAEDILLSIRHVFFNKSIEELIEQNKAVLCVQVVCPQTFFRKTYLSSSKEQEILILQDELRNKVIAEFFVVAKQDISDYENDKAHPDYDGLKFQLSKGDVISYGGRFNFVADKQWMSNKSVSSFMAIRCGNKERGPMDIDLSSESGKIIIELSKSDFSRFRDNARNDTLYPVYHSCIVFPALMYALNQMVTPEGKEQYEEYKWYQVLEERKRTDAQLREIGWEVANIATLAQVILKDPIDRVFNSVEAFTKEEEEG